MFWPYAIHVTCGSPFPWLKFDVLAWAGGGFKRESTVVDGRGNRLSYFSAFFPVEKLSTLKMRYKWTRFPSIRVLKYTISYDIHVLYKNQPWFDITTPTAVANTATTTTTPTFTLTAYTNPFSKFLIDFFQTWLMFERNWLGSKDKIQHLLAIQITLGILFLFWCWTLKYDCIFWIAISFCLNLLCGRSYQL